ncbi:lipocalin-like domain-containing protein [Ideonella livida]|uniref:Carotenoid 1,2-hydratase n=1 Tax=Ideonella livida TaxID=2707176 RepID=A0A7C9PI14_9BURK|nr:lipocalin-like domain-containing protein [Ideonella livida]NDY92309.1 carotenoid 1,2-hydratase [Ideonella livida]
MSAPHPARRRHWLGCSAAWAFTRLGAGTGLAAGHPGATWARGPQTPPKETPDPVRPDRALQFPRDHGAHPGARIEWWYLTGWLRPTDSAGPTQASANLMGFQVTFFRSLTGWGQDTTAWSGRLVPRQLLLAHAALTTLGATPRHQHDQRLQRWSGEEPPPGVPAAQREHLAAAARADLQVHLGDWFLRREPGPPGGAARYETQVEARSAQGGFGLRLQLQAGQALLAQGDGLATPGFSRKGPGRPGSPPEASHYYSHPHLAVQGRLRQGSREQAVQGLAWLDHEWSDTLMPAGAAGWDWLGMLLDDGSALTVFRLRQSVAPQADAGRAPAVWAGGSWRAGGAQAPVRRFQAHEVKMEPLDRPPAGAPVAVPARWRSPATGATYPLHWRLETPAGHFELVALMAAQEMDTAGTTGTVYWEGLSELREAGSGRRLGWGYLEMTGYAGRLRL